MDVITKLSEQGLLLPEPPKPGGLYESVRIVENIAYVAIQFPLVNNKLVYRGRLGLELTTQNGYHAAELCALNVLAQINKYVGFERINSLNMIEAYMLTVDDWDDFPKVLDGASSLFLKTLGDAGRHARALYGVHRLPMNAPIALTTSFTLKNVLS
ncbi:RidA family protein [Spirosoma arcticum]